MSVCHFFANQQNYRCYLQRVLLICPLPNLSQMLVGVLMMKFSAGRETNLRDKLTLGHFKDTHMGTHTFRAWMEHIPKPSDRQKVMLPRPAAPAPPLLSCPSSEQPLNSLLPRHSTGGKQSAPGRLLSHQMAWEMNRAIILVLDNSSDEANYREKLLLCSFFFCLFILPLFEEI